MITCVVIPYFAAAVTRLDQPMLANMPLMLVQYGSKRSKVAAVSVEAAHAGVTPNMPLSRARAYCPEAHLLPFDQAKLEAVVERILLQLWVFTNRVEVDSLSGTFYLDLGSLKEEDARFLGDRIYDCLHQILKAPLYVGLAQGKFSAYAAAVMSKSSVTYVGRGDEAALLSSCPISLLPLSKAAARKLHQLCIRQIGQFAILPRTAVLSQFGKEGKLLYLLAQGQDSRPVKPRQMPKTETVSRQFDQAVTGRIRLETVLHHMADALTQRLEARSSALHAVNMTIQFERNNPRTETLYLVQPTVNAATLVRVLVQLLDRMQVQDGITGIEVGAAHLVPNLPRQLELFRHQPARAQLVELARVLCVRHDTVFYEAVADESASLLPERRFHWDRIS